MRLLGPNEKERLDPFVGMHVWHATFRPGSALGMPEGHIAQPYDILLGRIDEGAGSLEVAGSKVVTLSVGDVACALAGSPRRHFDVSISPLRATVVLCGSADTSRETISTLETFGVDLAPLVRSLRRESRVIAGTAELTRLFHEVDESLAARDEQRCRLAIVTLLREVAQAGARRAGTAGRDAELASAACAIMGDDLAVTHTVDELARRLEVSPSTFKRAFSRAMGVPVHAWLTDQRMQRACELLSGTALSVADVANAVGYANPSKFSDAFARHMGKTPTAWRG